MKLLLVLTCIMSALCTFASAQGKPQDPERERLLQELSVRLQSQRVELPKGIYLRGTGVYESIGGRGAASAYVNTLQKESTEGFSASENNEAGIFTESRDSISYEGLQRETPAGMGSVFEMVSSDFYKPTGSAGWMRFGTKQLSRPDKPARQSHQEMELPAGFGTAGVGPLAAQWTLASQGFYNVIVERDEKQLAWYRIDGTSDSTYSTFTLTMIYPVEDDIQTLRFVFDDSRNGVMVMREVKTTNITSNHTSIWGLSRLEYAPSPALLADAGIPYILTRSHQVSKASPRFGSPLENRITYDFRFSGIEAIAGEPAPPEWYTKWQKAWDESEAYKATLAAKGS